MQIHNTFFFLGSWLYQTTLIVCLSALIENLLALRLSKVVVKVMTRNMQRDVPRMNELMNRTHEHVFPELQRYWPSASIMIPGHVCQEPSQQHSSYPWHLQIVTHVYADVTGRDMRASGSIRWFPSNLTIHQNKVQYSIKKSNQIQHSTTEKCTMSISHLLPLSSKLTLLCTAL